MRVLRIGELAALARVSTRTVRHYHRIGLLPEPARDASGYRAYELRDAVRLLRVRRLVELGLSLNEVADALADDEGRDLREILTELDADLAAQEQRIQARRQTIARLLAGEGDLTMSAEHAAVLAELEHVAGGDHPALERERPVLELIEPFTGAQAPQAWETYRRVLADRELTERMLAAARRFDELAGTPPRDPAVDALAAEMAGFGEAIRGLLPEEVWQQQADPEAADRMLRAVTAGMDPAQTRCMRLAFQHWREQPS